MSMRKYIRAMLRGQAEKMGAKSSKFVNYEFDRRQIKKYGIEQREINKAKGTHPKSRWKARFQFARMQAERRKDARKKRGIAV